MSAYCWATVCDAGPALKQHWVNVSCLLVGMADIEGEIKLTFIIAHMSFSYYVCVHGPSHCGSAPGWGLVAGDWWGGFTAGG